MVKIDKKKIFLLIIKTAIVLEIAEITIDNNKIPKKE